MNKVFKKNLIKLDSTTYEIPQSYRQGMHVPARIFANELMIEDVLKDRSLWQLVNVSTLPGIVKAAFAMPDVHEGYGFPIGGVAGFDIDQGGVISPGGIGYDINCGVRLLVANMSYEEIKSKIEILAEALFHKIPSGVGQGGKYYVDEDGLDHILTHGAQGLLKQGIGNPEDIVFCEENGRLTEADPSVVSQRAKKRGFDQIGTLGSGNHFLEIQYIDEIFDEEVAQVYNLKKGSVTVMIHCGSRGLGHQVCTDYVRAMLAKQKKHAINVSDRELICAPFQEPIAQQYFKAMNAAANFAWANRHMIGYWTRKVWKKVLGSDAQLDLLYDLSHNIGKIEEHLVNGSMKKVIMHRKGATRSFGPGHKGIPLQYQAVGQPVLIPGTMGTASYILAGTKKSMDQAFGSCCHGAGRVMSRSQAKKKDRGGQVRKKLAQQGIIIKSDSNAGIAEEAPYAYKDIEVVVDVVQKACLAKRVARVRPLAVIKGS